MYNITCDINDLSFFNAFYELFNLKNVLVENHGLLSVILYYTQVIIQSDIKTLLNQMQMDGAYSMVQHVGLIVVPYLKLMTTVNHFISVTKHIYHVSHS